MGILPGRHNIESMILMKSYLSQIFKIGLMLKGNPYDRNKRK